MKKFLILLSLMLLTANAVFADEMDVFSYANTNMKNFWQQNGKREQKILEVGTKIINANKLEKRIAIQMIINNNTINAHTDITNKTVSIYSGLLPYLDNDDELAFVIGHEMGHAIDAYDGGFFKWANMKLNSKEYEYNADLIGVDLMAKAGYNPLAAICTANKWMPEDYWDFWVFTSHPKTSSRLLKMYENAQINKTEEKSNVKNNCIFQNSLLFLSFVCGIAANVKCNFCKRYSC